MDSKEILKIYEENAALLKGHFLLSSGLHSNEYLQSERVMQYPHIASKVIGVLADKLYNIDFTTVVSPAVGGIRFGYELASQLKKRTVFTERVDGVMQFRRGFELYKGEKVVVAEDVVSTGKSTKECMEAIRQAGGEIVAVVSIIDRSKGKADFGVPYMSLASADVVSYSADECPLCAQGIELVKPGSRNFKKD